MGRSPLEVTRRRTRSTKSEAAEAKMASSEEVTRRRTRSTKSEAKVASSEEVTRRRTRSTKSEAKVASSEEGTRRRRTRSTKSEAAEAKMAASPSSEGNNRILKLESEEDRKILMKVMSEEGKILKLKKEYTAASQARFVPDMIATVEAAQPAVKKTKKVLVRRLMTMTKAQIDFVKAMATHPCPTRNLTEDELAKHSKGFLFSYHKGMDVSKKRLAYYEALIDQQEQFGYAVDESEVEITDDEGDDMVENY